MGKSGSIGWALAFELAPAAIFGGSVGFALATCLGQPLLGVAPASSAAAAFGAAWLGLSKFASPARPFPIADFEEAEVEYEQPSALSELLEQADVAGIVEQLGAASDHEAGGRVDTR